MIYYIYLKGECPDSQKLDGILYLKECANLTYPLNREVPSMGNVTAFLRRSYYGNEPTQKAVFLVAGGPGDSTRTLLYQADYMLSLYDTTMTIYTLDQRGTGLSSSMTCTEQPVLSFNPYNESTIATYKTCNEEIISKFTDVYEYYSTEHGTMDLKETIDKVWDNGLTTTVSIYALSAGTYHTNVLLQIPGVKVTCVVFDGPGNNYSYYTLI